MKPYITDTHLSIKIKLIEIGIGPHAKRVYVPALKELGFKLKAEIALAIDVKEKEVEVREFFNSINLYPDFFFVDPFKEALPKHLEKYLTDYVLKHKIDGVIISTEPLSHKAYSQWALNLGLNILLDKPITTNENVVVDFSQAQQIEDDYLNLLKDYLELQKIKKTIFSVNVQRRFNSGFQIISELIQEIAIKTNCPVTAIHSTHCDGQWRLPSEIVKQDYHPYNSGYGKASHSGYHIFDAIYNFYKVSKLTGKIANSMEVFSSFVQPRGFLKQLSEKDYEFFFGDKYKLVQTYSDEELWVKYHNYGEIDVSAILRLLKDGENIANVTINLLHNGFARRSWLKPGQDLYGNGRVKHEYHNIQQGPFQNIQVHSYHSQSKHGINTDSDSDSDYELGGNNHFDIYVFRNIGMTGSKESLKVIRMSDIKDIVSEKQENQLGVEKIKYYGLIEFIRFIRGEISKDQLTSNIDDHLMPVQIMSGVYKSHILHQRGENPIVKYDLHI